MRRATPCPFLLWMLNGLPQRERRAATVTTSWQRTTSSFATSAMLICTPLARRDDRHDVVTADVVCLPGEPATGIDGECQRVKLTGSTEVLTRPIPLVLAR